MIGELFSFVETSLNKASDAIQEAGDAAVTGLRMLNNSASAALAEQIDTEDLRQQQAKIDEYLEERENARFMDGLRRDTRMKYYNEVRANTAKLSASDMAAKLGMKLPSLNSAS